MNEKEFLAQQKHPLSAIELESISTLRTSTAACITLLSSTVICKLPENDPRRRKAESCATRFLTSLDAFISAFGLAPIPPSPEMLGMKKKDGIPVIQGRIVGPNPELPGNWLVDALCPYCRQEHRHGWATGVGGLRAAHCRSGMPQNEIEGESPLRETGYWIELDEVSQKIVDDAKPQKG